MRDYYETLELDATASPDQIKTNYRRLAMKWHPDRNAGSTAAEERFKSISEAYAILSDSAQRAQYDAYLAGGGPQAQRETYPGGFGESPFGQARTAQNGGFGFAWDFRGFSAEEAEDLFTREMYALATELTLQNVGWRDIAAELVSRGCPAEVAAQIARKMETRRKKVVRDSAKPYFVRSAVSGFLGFILFGLFGGIGFGLLGIMGFIMCLSGGYNLLRAMYFIATGNAPRTIL